MALIGLTALVSVEDTLQLKKGETILIQGGAGGVASFAIQIAKHIGARVITTASAANHAYLKTLGPDQIIDYNKDDFTKVVSNIDAVFDTVGGDVALGNAGALTDPLVRGLHLPGQLVVGDDSFGQIGATPLNDGPNHSAPPVACSSTAAGPGAGATCFSLARPSTSLFLYS